MTNSELQAAIVSYTENTFPDTYLADGTVVSSVQQIATFITQAEERIFNTVQFPSLRRNVTGFTSANNKYLACPNDFLSTYSMAIEVPGYGQEFLLNKDVNFIRQAYPLATDTATPKYYALFGPSFAASTELSFILGPTPDARYAVELHYFFYPESITVSANGTSWLGDNFDPVLLYGALVEAATFMKSEADMVALYNGKYQEALGMAKRLGNGMEMTDQYRSGQAKVRVT
jgi:hypothetical protein